MARPLVLLGALFGSVATARYVSYEDAVHYTPGDRIPVVSNKLTSPTALSSIDYIHAAVCDVHSPISESDSAWGEAVAALHGDAFWETFSFTVGKDETCVKLCESDTSALQDAIERDFFYNWSIDGLPLVFNTEDDLTKTTRYWGGVPVGHIGAVADNRRYENATSTDVFIYNHFSFTIYYESHNDGTYTVTRNMVQPYSVNRNVCGGPIKYDRIALIPPQLAGGTTFYTYDIEWVAAKLSGKRWDIFLSMDNAVPAYIEFMGFFLGCFILCSLLGVLCTWVLRDLSYKPVVNDSDVTEEEAVEVQMWPLSTRIFFPPAKAPILLCIMCGSGAHLLSSGLLFVILFRTGIANQTQGANILTPAIVVYCATSPVGGYVTTRLYTIFHGDSKIALASSLVCAITYPLIGMLISFLVFDVLPDADTPNYNAMANAGPLILLWILSVWPLTVLGGYFGIRAGVLQDFPVSEGSFGYQDLNLQGNSECESKAGQGAHKEGSWNRCIANYGILILLLTGGLLPVLSSFVGYSYSVAGPIFLDSYSVRSYTISSFVLFVLVSGVVSLLTYYKKIRRHDYHWWWSSFAVSGSSGIYIFLLSMSWLLFKAESHISGNTMVLYMLWFGYLAMGVSLMSGFVGVAFCICFNKNLYTHIMRGQTSK